VSERTRVLIGLPKSRSGSTFMRDVLTGHPAVWIGHETRLYCQLAWTDHFQNVWQRRERYPDRGKRVAGALDGAFKAMAQRYPNLSRRRSSPKLSAECIIELEKRLFPNDKIRVLGDKGYISLPPTKLMLNSLLEAVALPMPMKVIYIYRDPRNVFTSIRRFAAGREIWQPLWVHDPFRHSIEWVEAWENWEKIKKQGKVPWLEIKYETLINEPDKQLARVAKFLGLNNAQPFVGTFKKKLKGSVGNWQKQQPNIESQMHPSIFALMEKLGYKRGK